jgi:UDP-N-acetylmuramoyl-tripeptide--D-alanyl-D-alanine ligase
MVELGRRQRTENARFAEAASVVASDLVVVGRTNRRALREGASRSIRRLDVSTREDAVAWVRSNLAAGDAVLYENDLPDHYP